MIKLTKTVFQQVESWWSRAAAAGQDVVSPWCLCTSETGVQLRNRAQFPGQPPEHRKHQIESTLKVT